MSFGVRHSSAYKIRSFVNNDDDEESKRCLIHIVYSNRTRTEGSYQEVHQFFISNFNLNNNDINFE